MTLLLRYRAGSPTGNPCDCVTMIYTARLIYGITDTGWGGTCMTLILRYHAGSPTGNPCDCVTLMYTAILIYGITYTGWEGPAGL